MTNNDPNPQSSAAGTDQPVLDHRRYGAEMALVVIDGEEVVAL